MYSIVLAIHSWVRWAALVAGIGATLASARGSNLRDGLGRIERWGLVLTLAVDLQLLLGLLLYFVVSPELQIIRADFSAALQDPKMRFWAVEHVGTMVGAVVLVHLGRVLGTNARTTASKRILSMTCYGLATIAMIAATPWPWTSNARPLFRL
jgi:hypothetical protein